VGVFVTGLRGMNAVVLAITDGLLDRIVERSLS
jgi:hypothetical protein